MGYCRLMILMKASYIMNYCILYLMMWLLSVFKPMQVRTMPKNAVAQKSPFSLFSPKLCCVFGQNDNDPSLGQIFPSFLLSNDPRATIKNYCIGGEGGIGLGGLTTVLGGCLLQYTHLPTYNMVLSLHNRRTHQEWVMKVWGIF